MTDIETAIMIKNMARRQAEKYLESLGVSASEYLFDGVNHVIYFYKNK